MKRLTVALLTIATLTGTHAAERELVWSDEFDHEGLPDASKWGYEEGFIRNGELQCYTKARKENARVEKGMLIIEGRKEHFENPGKGAKSANYTSASLTTRDLGSWRYGRIEVRAKLPQGKGVWPAIWTLGENISKVNWPKCGEIDIMEFVGKEPDTIHATVHYAVNGRHQASGNRLKIETPFDAFHVYAAEWYPDHIDFFCDDQKYHTFPIDKAGEGDENPFRKPHYLKLNLALGGSWGGPIDDGMLPQKFLIDYVRIYKLGK